MSAPQRSSRSRLKTRLERLSPALPENPNFTSNNRRRASTTQPLDKRKPSPSPDVTRDSVDVDHVSDMDHEDLPSPVSNASSSSLSELEEPADTIVVKNATNYTLGEGDSEAETERLELSPQKLRMAMSNKVGMESEIEDGGDIVDREIDGTEEVASSISPSNGDTTTKEKQLLVSRSGSDFAGQKRKRTSSATVNGSGLNGPPAAKRSASSREASRPVRGIKRMASLDEVAVEEESAENLSETSLPLAVEETNETNLAADPAMDDGSDEEHDDQIEEINNAEDAPGSNGEIEEAVEADGDEDAAEAAVRSEDEAAKKKAAIESLKPIENFFAIFRDRIYDEKLARLSAELDLLKQPITTHADFTAMRQCIDTRRDEKIQLEQATLGYKLKALENRCVAERAQLHSQYFQCIRDIREAHIEKICEQQCRMKREMRQLNKQETDFQYVYNPRRALQVRQQQAYNTEVSILSGIARHHGFPAAPAIEGLRSVEIEEDLRQMKTPSQPSKLNRLLAKSRAVTSAAEEQFLEQTPWANPNHPAVQQAVNLERQVSALQPMKPGSYMIPTTPGWMAEFPKAPNVTSSVLIAHPENSVTTQASFVKSRPRLSDGRHYEIGSPMDRAQATLVRNTQSPPFEESFTREKSTTAKKSGVPVAQSSSSSNQLFPTSITRSDQISETYENSAYTPRLGTFGTPILESGDPAATGEALPVKREDDHERFAFTAMSTHDPHFAGGALPAGIAMEGFELR